MLAPAAILAVWGSHYVWECVLVLSQPGKPAQLTFKAGAGNMRIRAESYVIDWDLGTARFDRLALFEPGGAQIAAADVVKASGIRLPLTQPIVARIGTVTGTITRLPNGRFDIQGYIPERKGPASDIPYAVTIDRAQLAAIDRFGPKPYRQNVIARDVEIRGVGDKWLADGAAELPGMGNLRGEVQSLPNEGFWIRARTPGLQLAGLLDHLRSTPDSKRFTYLAQISASSFEAVGPGSVFIPKNASFRAEARLKATATDVNVLGYGADEAFFDGVLTETEAQGALHAKIGPTSASLDGSLDWRQGVALGGKLVADSPSTKVLPGWLRKLIPAEITFRDAHLDGWLAFRRSEGVRLEANVTGASAILYGQAFDRPNVRLAASPRQVRVAINSALWSGTPIAGAVLIGVGSSTMAGALTAQQVDLAEVGRRFGTRGLSGRARVSVLLGGSRDKPVAILEAEGHGSYRFRGRPIAADFQAAGQLVRGDVRIERFKLAGDAGTARAVGTLSLKDKRLALKVDASDVRLEKLRSDLSGTLNASGIVRGTLGSPRFDGRALALGAEYNGQQIPFASAEVSADAKRLVARDLRIVKGTGVATGVAALTWRNLGLEGTLSAQGVLLNEYLGDQALGSVAIPKLTLGGTLNRPQAAGTAFGEDLVLGGIRVDRADVASELVGTTAKVQSFTAKLGEGTITGSGHYDYAQQSGEFRLRADNLSLERITPPGKAAANVSGVLSGQATATVLPPAFWQGRFKGPLIGDASGTLGNVALNHAVFGHGRWDFHFNGQDVTGNATIANLDRFFILENVDYDTKSTEIQAQVSVLNGALEDLYASIKPFFPDIPYEVREKLDDASGNLNATVAFSGLATDPDYDIKVLDALDLELHKEPLGALKAALAKEGTVWSVRKFDWVGPQGTLMLQPGSVVDTAREMRVDGEITNFDLKYVGLINPDWSMLKGSATASFLATGLSTSPRIRASAESTENTAISIGESAEKFRINLDTIDVSAAQFTGNAYTGGLQASGKFYYRGLTGEVKATLPFSYPFTIPDGFPIYASLEFPSVDIKQLAEYASALDVERSSGKLTGTIAIQGPKSALKMSGSLTGEAKTLAFLIPSDPKLGPPTLIQTTLGDATIDLSLSERRINLKLYALSSEGGDFSTDLSADLPDLGATLEDMLRGEHDALSRSPLHGTIKTNRLAVKQDSKSKQSGSYHAKLSTNLDIGGTLLEPRLKGSVGITETNLLLPSVFEGAGPGADLLFNPHFEVEFRLDEAARFRTSTADVTLTGSGNLTGSLADPNFNGLLTVQRGRLNLPTTRVTLEEGGTIRPSYGISAGGDSAARVDVNLEGRTAVTSVRFGDTVQRYDIRLFITGDLLTEGGLNLNATSDPPDLSKDEILALLGQTDVLKTIGSGTGFSRSETESRIRNALMSVAIPQLTESFTSQLASNLGLEYLNIEYNAVEGASLAFAKVLGKGLIVQGRRQISPTIGNRRPDYELKLNYRLPTRNAALSRLVFSAGLDQDRPWKLGVEYGFRF